MTRNEKVYEIRLTSTASIQIEIQQTDFMNSVFDLAEKSGIVGTGIEITMVEV